MKKILILYTDKNDFARFYLRNMTNEDVDALPIYRYRNKGILRIMQICMLLHLPAIHLWFADWRRKLAQYSTVVIFEELPTECVVEYVKRKNSSCRIIYWYWNTVKRVPKNRNIAEYWSFDYADCKKYRLNFNNQFGFIVGNRNEMKNVENTDVFFVGIDKHRYAYLKKIEKVLNEKGINTKFLIVRDRSTPKNSHCLSNMLPYDEVIKEVKQSRCLLDIVKEGQTGVTLRFIEAAFYGKKVITNNKYVLEHPLYDKNRVFILEYDEWERISEFVNKKEPLIKDNDIFDYTYQGWLNKFGITNKREEMPK